MAVNQKETPDIYKKLFEFDFVEYYRNAYENSFAGSFAEAVIKHLGLTDILVQAGVIPIVPSHPALAHLSKEEQLVLDDYEEEVLIDAFEQSPEATNWDDDEWGRMIMDAHEGPRYLRVGMLIGQDGRKTEYQPFKADHYPCKRDADTLQKFFRVEYGLPTQMHEEFFREIGIIHYFEAAGILKPHFSEDQRSRAFRYLYIGALIGYFEENVEV